MPMAVTVVAQQQQYHHTVVTMVALEVTAAQANNALIKIAYAGVGPKHANLLATFEYGADNIY